MHPPRKLSIHGQMRSRQSPIDSIGGTSHDAALRGATKAFSAHEQAKPKPLPQGRIVPGTGAAEPSRLRQSFESGHSVDEAALSDDRISPDVRSLVQGFKQSVAGKRGPSETAEADTESLETKRLRAASTSSRRTDDAQPGMTPPRPIVRGRSIKRPSQLSPPNSQQSHNTNETTTDHDHLQLPGLDNSWMRVGASRTRSDGSDSRSSSVSRSNYLNPRAGLNESALADAIVASSLASSLASSRAPSPVKAPKPPPPRRKSSRKSALFHRARSSDTDQPRDAQGHVGMRQTLRKEVTPQPDAETEKRGHKHFMNHRPNKHHEGSRKRWRDIVTESERKRYEGVWSANKGINLPIPQPAVPNPSPTATSELVLDLIVRDIWSRSRLPVDHLAEVWDLVNMKSAHALGREEFVVGMWLIDQKLKGHKLPTRVSPSVWESVQHHAGLKIARRM